MSLPGIVVFGVGSDASVDQFDGCRATRGIMLRWFLPDLDFPPLGFDVHRAAIPDIPPLPFDDINIAAVSGKPSWDYAGHRHAVLRERTHIRAVRAAGWNRLVITPNAPVRVTFNGSAWRIQVRAEPVGDGIDVVAVVDGAETFRETLDQPNAQLLWRTRDVTEIAAARRRHCQLHRLSPARGQPLLDPHRAPLPAGARRGVCLRAAWRRHRGRRSRDAAARRCGGELEKRFADPFKAMLPALHRLARGDAPAAIPPDSLDPRRRVSPPAMARASARSSASRCSIRMWRACLGLRTTIRWRSPARNSPTRSPASGAVRRHEVDGNGHNARRFHEAAPQGRRRTSSTRRAAATVAFSFLGGALDFSLSFDGNEHDRMDRAKTTTATSSRACSIASSARCRCPRAVTLRLAWPAGNDPVFIGASWYDPERRTGILPSVYARDPGAPAGPASIDATVRLPASPSGIASAALDWPLAVGSDGATLEGEVIAYQVGRRFLGAPRQRACAGHRPATAADVLRPFAPLYLSQQSLSDAAAAHAARRLQRWPGPGARLVGLVGTRRRSVRPRQWREQPGMSARSTTLRRHPRRCWCRPSGCSARCRTMTVAVLGRSVEASRWLAASAAELSAARSGPRGGVGAAARAGRAARRHRRLSFVPAQGGAQSGAAADAPLVYPDWPAAIAQFGPLQIVGRGAIVLFTPRSGAHGRR